MASPFAVVTLVSSDSYLPGALAQVAALRDLHPSPAVSPEVDFQTVCIVTPESLDVATIRRLRKAFDLVIGVEILEQENERGLKLLGRPDLTTVLTKLHIFRLTQFKKIIFLDADVLPIRPLSHLFNTPHEFAAAPDVGWPDIFNSGVLVCTPGNDKFDELHQLIKTKPSWDGGDQGILNEWRGGDWHRLSFTYNTTPTAAYTYAPAYERYGSQISAIHFIGSNKPWQSLPYRAPFAGSQPEPSDGVQRSYGYEALVDRWFDVYDRHYRTETILPQAPFEVKPYSSVWDQSAEHRQPPPPANTLDLDELKRLAIKGVNTSAVDNRPGEGTYLTMPIEGRVDLMRPPKPVKEEAVYEVGPNQDRGNRSQTFEAYIGPEDGDRFPSDSFSYDEALSTPQARHAAFDFGSRWQTLPTPGPHETPQSPHPRPISLPATPTPIPHFQRTTSDFYASESESESLLLGRPASANSHHHDHHYRNESPTHHHPQQQHQHQHPQQYDHPHQHQHHPHVQDYRQDDQNTSYGHHQQQDHQNFQHHQHRQPSPQQNFQHPQQEHYSEQPPPQRPLSPPMVEWNPAKEPPPNTAPPANAFPSDTYFANIWDQSPSRQNDHTHSGPSPPDKSGFFQPPPSTAIPDTLIKQGHYRNVTGDSQAATPSPDRHKVKTVFPWEGKPRPLPGRVFPDSDAPSPSLFLSPGSQSQTSTTTPSTPETRGPILPGRSTPLSPLYGLPNSLNYANAWDTVPSIQKYASRLVKPPPPPPALAPAFDDDSYRKSRRRSRDDRSEVSSRDGDDEDNADDEDDGDEGEPAESSTKWDDDESDRETAQRRSRSGSVVKESLKSKKKEYKSQGVQTTITETRSQGIQVDPPKPERQYKRLSGSGKRHWPPASGPTITTTRDVSTGGHDLPNATAPSLRESRKGSPTSPRPRSPLISPREFISPGITVKNGGMKDPSPPLRPALRTASSSATVVPSSPASLSPLPLSIRSRASSIRSSPSIARQTSNDSSLGSPASSIGPLSPPEGHAILPPMKKGGRVWDPARGVDLFKKGSEEVLARFLRMGSFDEEAR